jgi:hypothetical protein
VREQLGLVAVEEQVGQARKHALVAHTSSSPTSVASWASPRHVGTRSDPTSNRPHPISSIVNLLTWR